MAKDKKTISNQPWEINTVIEAMQREGITVTRSAVEAAREQVGKDREQVYEFLRTQNQANGSNSI